jgi:phosphatidyl-myo-inositol dimannoside synthase
LRSDTRRPLRVLWIASEYWPRIGGIETYVASLTTELARLGHHVGLLTNPDQHPRECDSFDLHATLTLTKPASFAEWEASQAALAEHIRAFRPDVVHLASAGVAVYSEVIPASIPIVATVHGKDLTAPWQWLPGDADVEAQIVSGLRRAAAIITLSEATAAAVRARLGPVGVNVLAPGCELPPFPAPARPDGKPIILSVGRLISRKGHLHLLAGLERAASVFQWLVVGDGPARPEITAAIERSPLRDRVALLGAVSELTLAALYAESTLFALTPVVLNRGGKTDFEGFGLVFHEAAAFGVPAIASDGAGCREAVLDGRTGLLVRPDAPDAIAAAVDRLLSDEPLRRTLGRAARAHIERLGGWPRLAADVERVYRTLTPHVVSRSSDSHSATERDHV